jgi:mono/diheme cytochrome c family protein
LDSKDARVRAYGARLAGTWAEQIPNVLALLERCARDENPRVRLEAAVAASYLQKPEAVRIVTTVFDAPRDKFLDYAIRQSARALQDKWAQPLSEKKLSLASQAQRAYLQSLLQSSPRIPSAGENIYEMACLPCHQPEGKGLAGVYPPLFGSEWVRGDAARLIRIVLHGLAGPINVAGQNYGGPNAVPMPSLGGLTDEQIADVLTFVRAEFGAGSSAVSPEQVRLVRNATSAREKPWSVSELQTPANQPSQSGR